MKVSCIMLIDDNTDDNFFHERVIRKYRAADKVIPVSSGQAALDYLQSEQGAEVDLIFLDINMPGMNGWEFLAEFNKLDPALRKQMTVMLLTTSENPDDQERAARLNVPLNTKPLSKQILEDAVRKSPGGVMS